MKRTLEEWRSLEMPHVLSEEQANDWQAQVIIEAIHDIGCLYANAKPYTRKDVYQECKDDILALIEESQKLGFLHVLELLKDKVQKL